MNEELKKKVEFLKEEREMILHNIFCYEDKEEFKKEYEREVEKLTLINSIMLDVINTYPDVNE